MTESSHNLTGVKTILSVHALGQHLFVLDKMILTLIHILFSARSGSTTPPTVRCSLPSSKTVYHKFIIKQKNAALSAHFHSYLCRHVVEEWRLLWENKFIFFT